MPQSKQVVVPPLNNNDSLVLVLKVNTDSLKDKGICKSDRLNIFIGGHGITLEVWREGDQCK